MPRSIPPNVGLIVYRLVQEALRNVAKHSSARRAVVSISGKNGAILLSIKDAGRGFNPSRPRKRGLGLISMEERVRQSGGVFTLKTKPGEGVQIEARIPLVPKSGAGRR